MSADLLQAFGEPQENPWDQVQSQHQSISKDVEDDFGDFEDPEEEVLSNDYADRPVPRTVVTHGQDNTFDADWGDFEGGTTLFDADEEVAQTTTATQKEAQSLFATPPPLHVEEDDDFDPWEPVAPTPGRTLTEAISPQSPPAAPPLNTNDTRIERTSLPNTKEPPPANTPPPSVLLSLSATVLQASVSKPTDSASDQEREILRQRLLTVRAISRILAGRKLRWKRDNILSQSMRIGQAGKQSGMKLTNVDKTESRREDQEAAEVLRTWKQQVGSLRSTVSTVNAAHTAGNLRVPDLTENTPVRTAKAAEGALTAPKACFLCGLKRDERVLKVDVDVEDSFGEWWVEHWGHMDCVAFWNGHKSSLPHK